MMKKIHVYNLLPSIKVFEKKRIQIIDISWLWIQKRKYSQRGPELQAQLSEWTSMWNWQNKSERRLFNLLSFKSISKPFSLFTAVFQSILQMSSLKLEIKGAYTVTSHSKYNTLSGC